MSGLDSAFTAHEISYVAKVVEQAHDKLIDAEFELKIGSQSETINYIREAIETLNRAIKLLEKKG